MDSPDWLRTQLTSFTCPACGRRYRGSRIKLLADWHGVDQLRLHNVYQDLAAL